MIEKRRRREGKTDYKARLAMLKSGKKRIVFRKTNRYIIGQVVESEEAQDKVVDSVNSKELLNHGWPKKAKNSLKTLPAAYLTGYKLGKKLKEEAIFDTGLNRNIAGNRAYSFLKGVVDAGGKVNVDEKMFPKEDRVKGEHLSKDIDLEKIKEKIDKE